MIRVSARTSLNIEVFQMLENLRYVRGLVRKIVRHYKDVSSLYLAADDFPYISPGQYIMVWLPEYEEIPLSPSYQSNSIIRLTVKDRGETTHRINSMDIDDRIFIRGPYGHGFDLDRDGKYLLVGGGYGVSPLIYAGHILVDKEFIATYVEGVKTSSQSIFINEAEELGLKTILVSEDGSSGIKGLVTSYVENIIDDYDFILACGPEDMLIKLLRICRSHGSSCQVSVERRIKCGVGICGSCALGNSGLLVCRDGPVFDMKTLLEAGYLGDIDA